MTAKNWTNMAKTRAAMRAYDDTVALLMGCAAADADHLLLNTKRAWRDVLEAFAEDTAEFNRRETILGCAGAPFFEPFLRGILRGGGA